MNEAYNFIRLLGRVSTPPKYDHTVSGEDMLKLYVSASRLSGTEDILPVTVSSRLVRDVIEEGDTLEILGQIRSYNIRSAGTGRLIISVFARELMMLSEEEALICQDVNEAELEGRIIKPVVYRTTPFSREIADVFIAVERRYGKCDTLPCIAWGRNARAASELTVGDTVLIRGRLQSRQYNKQLENGNTLKKIAYELSCSSIEKRMDEL